MKYTFLPALLERGTKVLQFDVCCKAIDQNFDCGCDCYTTLHLYLLRSTFPIEIIQGARFKVERLTENVGRP